MKQFFVYILASKRNGTLYTGVSSNIMQRIYQHKHHHVAGFTKKYNISQLVWYEPHKDAETALTRERQIKKWNRRWKIRLIEQENPAWEDLYERIVSESPPSRG